MFSCRLCCFDEIDRFPRSIPGSSEGDPIAVGLRRSETFADAFSIMTSSPTERGVSRIEYEYSLTDQRKWFVACPACSHEFVMLWHHVVWDKGPAGEHLARTARIECPECHSRHDDAARAEMVRRGRWIATGLEFRRRRGYWGNCLMTLLPPKRSYSGHLERLVEEFLAAKHGGVETMRTFINTQLAETFEEESERPVPAEILYNRAREAGEYAQSDFPEKDIPAGVLMLSCGCDIQHDRVELEVLGLGEGFESWSIDYRVLLGSLEEADFRRELSQFLLRQYRHPSGHSLGLAITLVDSGDKPQSVYQLIKETAPRPVYASKGFGSFNLPAINPSRRVPRLLNLNVSVFKAQLYARLGLVAPGQGGYCHFPSDRSLSYYEQPVSERLVKRVNRGLVAKVFELMEGRRNESLDARVMAQAGAEFLRPDFEAIKRRLGIEGAAPTKQRRARPASFWGPRGIADV
jgi:phage terminase large subunit GpA-like protein